MVAVKKQSGIKPAEAAGKKTSSGYGPLLVDSFKALYAELDYSQISQERLGSLYARDIVFEDPFHRIETLKNFTDYFFSVYKNLTFIAFDFHESFIESDEAMVNWTMRYTHPKLGRKKVIPVEGTSHLKFSDKIYFHRDYFDGGQLLYEHVPVLGTLINQLKKRMI